MKKHYKVLGLEEGASKAEILGRNAGARKSYEIRGEDYFMLDVNSR